MAEGRVVRVLEEREGLSFVVYRWPDWSEANFTFQIQGWVDAKTLREPTGSENP